MHVKPFTVIVEGNIGCGKTTFIDYFKQYDGVSVLSEPVSLWQNCFNHNLLELMYHDPCKWSFSFQSYVQLTMLNYHLKPIEKEVKIMERSIFSAYVFLEKMLADKVIASSSASVLNEWFKWINTNTKVNVDLIVYLRSSPEVAYNRMLKRSRFEEKTVSFAYLKGLHELHEEWLYTKSIHFCPAPVLVINADLDQPRIIEEYEKYKPYILNKNTC